MKGTNKFTIFILVLAAAVVFFASRVVSGKCNFIDNVFIGKICCTGNSVLGRDFSKRKDQCFNNFINSIDCDLKEEVKNERLSLKGGVSASKLNSLTLLCSEVKDNESRLTCSQALDSKKACLAKDANYCLADDYFCHAVLSGRKEDCRLLRNLEERNLCFLNLAVFFKVNDVSICEEMRFDQQGEQTAVDFEKSVGRCYGALADIIGERYICMEQTSAPMRESCISYFREAKLGWGGKICGGNKYCLQLFSH